MPRLAGQRREQQGRSRRQGVYQAGATIAATAGVNLAADAAIGATVATTAGAVVATGGTIVVGAAVAAGVGYLVDNYYDDAKHTVKNWVD